MELAEILRKISSDKAVRRRVTQSSHFMFFHIFLSHHIQYDTAPFQKEMFKLSENEKYKLLEFMAFRGSGKSTLFSLSYPLWAMLGKQQKKCVLVVGKTQQQAKIHFWNIRKELERNALLKQDLGPFRTESEKWGAHSLELPRLDAAIFIVSLGQSVRGIKHGNHRPDLIICDDLEDSAPQSAAEREDLYNWFNNEIVPSGGENTRIVVLGNLIDEKSFMMRLHQDIKEGKFKGIFRAYPFWDDDGLLLWPGRFATKESVEDLQNMVADKAVWQNEYLLQYGAKFSLSELLDEVERRKNGKKEIEKVVIPQIGIKPTSMREYKISAPKRGKMIMWALPSRRNWTGEAREEREE